jgi:predicted RNase H-like HicB family nuclease
MSLIQAVGDVLHKVIKVDGETYRIRLEPDLDMGGYVVICESPPGCASQGDTVEEALEMIADEISLLVESCRERGWPLDPE